MVIDLPMFDSSAKAINMKRQVKPLIIGGREKVMKRNGTLCSDECSSSLHVAQLRAPTQLPHQAKSRCARRQPGRLVIRYQWR